MCLYTTINSWKIAEEDIECYKELTIDSDFNIRTPFQNEIVEEDILSGKKYYYPKEKFDINKLEVSLGEGFIHTYNINQKNAIICDICKDSKNILYKCIIPKGTKYYCDASAYAAEKIKFIEEIKPSDKEKERALENYPCEEKENYLIINRLITNIIDRLNSNNYDYEETFCWVGILNDLNGKEREIVLSNYKKITEYIIENQNNWYDKFPIISMSHKLYYDDIETILDIDFANFIYPLVRRITSERFKKNLSEIELNIEEIYNKLKEFIPIVSLMQKSSFTKVDIEAELCCLVADYYSENIDKHIDIFNKIKDNINELINSLNNIK